MQTLLDTLNGKATGSLSPDQIQDLIGHVNRLSTLTEKSKANLYIIRGLERSILSPNIVLSAAIAECRTNGDLVPIGLALRYGANKNLYLNTPTIGPAHVMVYAVSVMRNAGCNIGLINTVCLILIQMGSRTISPAFDQGGNRIDVPTKKSEEFDHKFMESIASNLLPRQASSPANLFTKSHVGAFDKISSISVQEWFRSQGLSDYSNPESVIQNSLDKETKLIIGTICDNSKLAYPDGNIIPSPNPETPSVDIVLPAFDDILLDRAIGVGQSFPTIKGLKLASEKHGENYGIGRCVDVGFSELFKYFLDQGLTVSYFTVTRLCLLLKQNFEMKDLIFVSELQTMLMHAISRGINLDTDQMTIISVTDDNIAQMILNEYRKPYWRKVCNGPQNVEPTKGLRTLGFAILGSAVADMTKGTLCEQLQQLSQADPASLKQAAIDRQKTRVGSIVASVQDFVDNKPTVTCRNKTILQNDPFTYNDAQMSFYADLQGAVWCFTSDMYEGLLAKGTNPHTNQPLPIPFQHQLRSQLELLKQLGVSTISPLSISDAIDTLGTPDDVTNKQSQFIVDTIIKTGIVVGVSENKLKSLDYTQMNRVLSTISMKQTYLPYLTPNHAFTVFCRAAYYAIKNDSALSKTFFLDINLQEQVQPSLTVKTKSYPDDKQPVFSISSPISTTPSASQRFNVNDASNNPIYTSANGLPIYKATVYKGLTPITQQVLQTAANT
jgi:hypothetical protein